MFVEPYTISKTVLIPVTVIRVTWEVVTLGYNHNVWILVFGFIYFFSISV